MNFSDYAKKNDCSRNYISFIQYHFCSQKFMEQLFDPRLYLINKYLQTTLQGLSYMLWLHDDIWLIVHCCQTQNVTLMRTHYYFLFVQSDIIIRRTLLSVCFLLEVKFIQIEWSEKVSLFFIPFDLDYMSAWFLFYEVKSKASYSNPGLCIAFVVCCLFYFQRRYHRK